MRHSVPEHSMQPWVAKYNFNNGSRGGVAFAVGLHHLPQKHKSHATIPLRLGSRGSLYYGLSDWVDPGFNPVGRVGRMRSKWIAARRVPGPTGGLSRSILRAVVGCAGRGGMPPVEHAGLNVRLPPTGATSAGLWVGSDKGRLSKQWLRQLTNLAIYENNKRMQ